MRRVLPAAALVAFSCSPALVTIRARVEKLIDEGKSEGDAVASKPTKDLDARWMRSAGFLSGDVFTRWRTNR